MRVGGVAGAACELLVAGGVYGDGVVKGACLKGMDDMLVFVGKLCNLGLVLMSSVGAWRGVSSHAA